MGVFFIEGLSEIFWKQSCILLFFGDDVFDPGVEDGGAIEVSKFG